VGEVTPPSILKPDHDTAEFSSDNESLDSWLNRIALQAGFSQTSRTFVICDDKNPKRVVGYYSIASASLATTEALDRIKAGSGRQPIPAVILARLAVDKNWQRKGLGSFLVFDAVKRVARLQNELGIRALLVHAIDENAKSFYQKLGFKSADFNPKLMMALLKDLKVN
jgi:GNAT superfamily N-acetyltransferase